jgi:hypothetical protein
MNATAYYRHIRSLGPFRAIEALALAREAAALDAKAVRPASPDVVAVEDGCVFLSFGIKVF